jgi:myosin heavy subunit
VRSEERQEAERNMSSVEGVLKTIHSTKRVTVTFQPEPWLPDELQTLMRRHKLNMTDAIHYGFKEWMTLRELKPSLTPVSSAQPETMALSWQEIACRLLIETPKKAHDCLNLHPPVRVMHPLTSPEVCKICQNEAEAIKQIAKTLATVGLNARTKAPIAQLIHGLELQRSIAQEESQHKDEQITYWRRRYDEAGATNKTLKQQIQECVAKEEKLRKKESALEKTDQEYSEKRTDLQDLPTLRKKVATLEPENKDLRNQSEFLANLLTCSKREKATLETENTALKNKVESLSQNLNDVQQRCDSTTWENGNLKDENKDLKENPMVPCPDTRLVRLSFCMKTCDKFPNCEAYPTNHDLSKYGFNEKPFQY